ncbi:hypothetical protein [Gryllotalpicola protaetiae]|uniref:Uncharacterized protein n=1 Tax=Gryllotalpicola protaetiae TaxID=2419771 RepID=A0A387BEJ1_9MICO|nr:hypothetical protein [Gryllotalpicola protaetiae]AYG02385.1 hypothetical protein D7I44_01770 [Gryllotalpicola protaetiae]
MRDYIIDPLDPETAIHTPTASIATAVYVIPAGKDRDDRSNWVHVGFADPNPQNGPRGRHRA